MLRFLSGEKFIDLQIALFFNNHILTDIKHTLSSLFHRYFAKQLSKSPPRPKAHWHQLQVQVYMKLEQQLLVISLCSTRLMAEHLRWPTSGSKWNKTRIYAIISLKVVFKIFRTLNVKEKAVCKSKVFAFYPKLTKE